MSIIWIGDFRYKQLAHYQDDNTSDYSDITADTADYTWFKNSASLQLARLDSEKSDVIIMLGFYDCVYSCVWENAFKVKTIASNYVKAINELVKDYSNHNFYVCSVSPVDADYPFSEHLNGIIKVNSLNSKIKTFNNKIKTSKATYIDTYKYLTSTSFTTRDGVLYDAATCKNLVSYISSHIATAGGSLFVPRLTAPAIDSSNPEKDPYWLSSEDTYKGLNPFFGLGQAYAKGPGDTLPNCTAYAWGRFYEITGERPKLSTGNAEQWYLNTSDGYSRGKTPALGAVMCWQAGPTTNPNGDDGAGHVAIVEQIKEDGSIVTSESGYSSASYWWTTTRKKGSDGNWEAGAGYKFQGFIYCPTTTAVTKDSLCTKNSYGITEEEMKPNAQYIWQYLGTRGWTINAVAALLGNLQSESKMSPAIWETTTSYTSNPVTKNSDGTYTLNPSEIAKIARGLGRSSSTMVGYGLVQWTPYTKYTDWCKTKKLPFWDIDSQLQRIEWEVENKKQWISRSSKGYDLSFKDFITSTKDAYWLAGAFAFCYERPAASSGSLAAQENLKKLRGKQADKWYKFLNELAPITSSNQLQITNFKVDKTYATKASVSCLVQNGDECKYKLYKGGKKLLTKSVTIQEDLIVFDVKDLVPNTSYKIALTVKNTSSKKTAKSELTFTTKQSYPDSVKSISLSCEDKLKTINSTFRLNVTQPESLGYWKNNGKYELQLIVNGKRIKTVDSIIKDIKNDKFTLNKKFGYDCKLGDTVQIGIRVWVKDSNGNKLFDDQEAKVSNSICILDRPVVTYLNID